MNPSGLSEAIRTPPAGPCLPAHGQADRTSEVLEAIREAEALVERTGPRAWCAELHRLRGALLTAVT